VLRFSRKNYICGIILIVLLASSLTFLFAQKKATNQSNVKGETNISSALQEWDNIHPRILLTPDRVSELKQAINSTHANFWTELRNEAEGYIGDGPSYKKLPVLALAYLMTNDARYANSAISMAVNEAPQWNSWSYSDLSAGRWLSSLAIAYDWLYDVLSSSQKSAILDGLLQGGRKEFSSAQGDKWWYNKYVNNHLFVHNAGLGMAGLAIYDKNSSIRTESTQWIELAIDKYQEVFRALGSDGANANEGVWYYTFGLNSILQFITPARDIAGVDMVTSNQWLQNTPYFILYNFLPLNSATVSSSSPGNAVNFSDFYHGGWGGRRISYGPNYLLRFFASEFSNSYAQWLANTIDSKGVGKNNSKWLNCIFYDPNVNSSNQNQLPTLRHFENYGLVSARSDWSGNESLITLKCGPNVGHQAVDNNYGHYIGGGHAHPDANHFSVRGNGEWLIRNIGYSDKHTEYENTLLIDNGEQLGGGTGTFDDMAIFNANAHPRVIRAISTPEVDHIAADASEAYPSNTGLQRFMRHLIFIKPNILIVADDIALSANHNLELRFHPENSASQQDDGSYRAAGSRAILRFDPLTTSNINFSAQYLPVHWYNPSESGDVFTISLQKNANNWRNAVALSWSAVGSEPEHVNLNTNNDLWTFTTNSQEITLDWSTDTVVSLSPDSSPSPSPSPSASPTSSPSPSPSLKSPDINNDGDVNALDLLLLLNALGSISSDDPLDLNSDGQININDILTILRNWGSFSGSPGGNIINNPGFESGNTDNWTFNTDGNADFEAVSPGYEGSWAGRIFINNKGSKAQLYQKNISLEPNTPYRLSFAAKSNTGHNLDVSIHKHGSPYTNYGLSSSEFNLTSSWQAFSVDFTTENFSNPVSDARLKFWFTPYYQNNDEYQIDQVSLVKL